MGTACSRCHTPVENDQVKCSTCGSTGTYEISKLDVGKIREVEKEAEEKSERIAKEEAEQIAKEEEARKQQEYDNSVEASSALKQKSRDKTIFVIVIALILIGVAFSYAEFFGLEY